MEMPMAAVDDVRFRRGPGQLLGSRRLEGRDAFAQDGDEISHHVRDRVIDAEEIGVEILFGDPIANLALKAGVELILGDGFEDGALGVGAWGFPDRRPCSSSAWRW